MDFLDIPQFIIDEELKKKCKEFGVEIEQFEMRVVMKTGPMYLGEGTEVIAKAIGEIEDATGYEQKWFAYAYGPITFQFRGYTAIVRFGLSVS